MSEIPVGAPACFAAASVFAHDSDVCRECKSYDACAAACVQTLESIRNVINVEDLLRRHQAARKQAVKALQKADQEAAAAAPPGGLPPPPLPVTPVQRKTKITKVEFELSPDQQDLIARLPIKPRELAVRLTKTGDLDKYRADLLAGVNTFDQSGPAFLRVATKLLLSGGFTKSTLREAYERDLEWTTGTAQSHVGIVCALLAAFKFVKQEPEGTFVVAAGV